MNTYPGFRDFFEQIASKLLLLGREPGKINLFFCEGPHDASTLVVAMKNHLTLPLLMVEFPDEDPENGETPARTIRSAFLVLDQAKPTKEGSTDIQNAIYQRAKPCAEQIFAYIKNLDDKMELTIGEKRVSMVGDSTGSWVGPVNNNLYGWRIEFNWRLASGVCLDPQAWLE